jgi:hypothetical protein
VRNFADNLSLIAVTLWVGGLWAIGYIAAPVLFSALGDKMLAGMLAGKMFTVIAYVGLACGGYLVLYRPARFGVVAFKQGVFWIAVAMLLLTIAGHFGIQPILEALKEQAFPRDVMQSVLKNRFAAWHGVSSILYLLLSLLGLVLVFKQRGSR